ncbi:MAG: zinc ribbon domain-containing protein [Patescibacteria group bacterium]|nr:zinc ribbon domain-containing protein [Patescibacteria group bacterium]
MFCKQCGTKIGEDAIFCSKCGVKTGSATDIPRKEKTQPITVVPASNKYSHFLHDSKKATEDKVIFDLDGKEVIVFIEKLGIKNSAFVVSVNSKESYRCDWESFEKSGKKLNVSGHVVEVKYKKVSNSFSLWNIVPKEKGLIVKIDGKSLRGTVGDPIKKIEEAGGALAFYIISIILTWIFMISSTSDPALLSLVSFFSLVLVLFIMYLIIYRKSLVGLLLGTVLAMIELITWFDSTASSSKTSSGAMVVWAILRIGIIYYLINGIIAAIKVMKYNRKNRSLVGEK